MEELVRRKNRNIIIASEHITQSHHQTPLPHSITSRKKSFEKTSRNVFMAPHCFESMPQLPRSTTSIACRYLPLQQSPTDLSTPPLLPKPRISRYTKMPESLQHARTHVCMHSEEEEEKKKKRTNQTKPCECRLVATTLPCELERTATK